MQYFKDLLALLTIEKQEDLQFFEALSQKSSIADRRLAGYTWYPLAIKSTEPAPGDYMSVEFERTSHTDLQHYFRPGCEAELFSGHDPLTDRIKGTVAFISGNRLRLNLKTDELPEWSGRGKLGINLLFDRNSYDDMEQALKNAGLAAAAGNKLVRVLTGDHEPLFQQQPLAGISENSRHLKHLNAGQLSAVHHALAADSLAMIQGPPGTGKTTALVGLIGAFLDENEGQVLVLAPSNAAVDLLTGKLSEAGIAVLRIGNPAKISEKLSNLTLDGRMQGHEGMKEVKKMKKQAGEFRSMAHKYKRSFGRAEQEQRRALFSEAHKLLREVEKSETYIVEDLIGHARVLTATLIGSNYHLLRKLQFGAIFMDEAGQALEPAAWVSLLRAGRLIMAGDHKQLPPTVKSREAEQKGLGVSLLEKCASRFPAAVSMLEIQYRMHEQIMQFSSSEFYHDRLKAHDSVKSALIFSGDRPLMFIDTAGCSFDEVTEGNSLNNPAEAEFLVRHLVSLIERAGAQGSPPESVAIISPYKEQVLLVRELIKHAGSAELNSIPLTVNTVDSFQGQESDVVYISLVRSNRENRIGFLSDIRRMNVAMTRAQRKLVIIGDSTTIGSHAFYGRFIDYCQRAGAYESAWEHLV